MELKDWIGVIGGLLGMLSTGWTLYTSRRDRKLKEERKQHPLRINATIEVFDMGEFHLDVKRSIRIVEAFLILRVTNIYEKAVTIERIYITIDDRFDLEVESVEALPYYLTEAQTFIVKKKVDDIGDRFVQKGYVSAEPKCTCILFDGRRVTIVGQARRFSIGHKMLSVQMPDIISKTS
jgi:hypothetical protein